MSELLSKQVNALNELCNEGTIIILPSKQVNGCQRDGFLSMRTQTGAIQLTMAGT